ncbi:MAG TPA: hypothetical protein VFB61_00330, partial [Gemmatimonadales bacterium]|nr:hypothetical protein [Gemmatimonadales bacterium]
MANHKFRGPELDSGTVRTREDGDAGAEQSRRISEQERDAAEQQRVLGEQIRQTGESLRVSAEELRQMQ